MEYTVITNDNYDEFLKWVSKALDKGWKPCGGVSISYIPTRAVTLYAQAFIK